MATMNKRRRENVRNVKDMAIIPVEEYEVAEWHPLPNGQGDPTQVHLLIRIRGVPSPLGMRMKTREAVDQLIEALSYHRDRVFPPN